MNKSGTTQKKSGQGKRGAPEVMDLSKFMSFKETGIPQASDQVTESSSAPSPQTSGFYQVASAYSLDKQADSETPQFNRNEYRRKRDDGFGSSYSYFDSKEPETKRIEKISASDFPDINAPLIKATRVETKVVEMHNPMFVSHGPQIPQISTPTSNNAYQILSGLSSSQDSSSSILTQSTDSLGKSQGDMQIYSTKSKKILSYKKLVDKNADVYVGSDSLSLFSDKHLAIDIHDIENVYDFFALERIIVHYLNLNRKISILEQVHDESLRHHFDYDKLLKDMFKLKTCTDILGLIDELTNTITKDMPLDSSNTIIFVGEEDDVINEQFDMLRSYVQSIPDEEIRLKIIVLICAMKKDEVSSRSKTIPPLLAEMKKILAKHYDPHIFCKYYIDIKSSENGGIIPTHISLYGRHQHGSVSLRSYKQQVLRSQDPSHIKSLLNDMYMADSTNVLVIFNPHSGQRHQEMHFVYEIKEIIPFTTGFIKIYGQHRDTKVLSSYINNDPDTSDETVRSSHRHIRPDPIHKWLYDRSMDHSILMTSEEYALLPVDIRKMHKYIDIDKPIMYVDTLYDYLLADPNSADILDESMRDSFRELAYLTSPHQML